MRKLKLQKLQEDILDNNMVHLIYEASGMDDMIHPFSAEGNEVLSDRLVSFLERHRSAVPKKAPVLLEVAGNAFTEKEKDLIGNTIWTNYCLSITDADRSFRYCIRKGLLYILCGILSGILIFWLGQNSNEVLSTFAYIPFWFFTERFFIFLAFDSVPLWKDKKWYTQMASMRLVFSDDNGISPEDYDCDEIEAEIRERVRWAERKTLQNRMFFDCRDNQKLVSCRCHTDSLADMVQMPLRKGREMMTDEMGSYIDQIEPFIRKDTNLELTIDCNNIGEEDYQTITSAIRNYYSYVIASEEKLIRDSNFKIKLFLVLFVVAAIVLLTFGAGTDAVTHELLIVPFWMFADSAMEFLLIDNIGSRKRIRVLERFMNMKIKQKELYHS